MSDPYSVLGISRGAGPDEIKKAYRKMSRVYHPDANVNNPNKAQAEEKFKEIQEAYNQIMYEREHGEGTYGNNRGTAGGQNAGGYGYGYGGGFGGGFGGYGQQTTGAGANAGDSEQMRAAINYINSRQYAQAMQILESMTEQRSARWYYVHAYANYGMGNIINAREDARRAASMEPNNFEYQSLVRQMEGNGGWYQNMGQQYGGQGDMGNFCARLLCFEMLCNCCCCGPGGF